MKTASSRSCCVVFLLAALLIGCTSSENSLPSSGDAEMDKTAAYVKHTVEKLRRRPSLDTPSALISYMTSTQGSAELTPPHPELEPDMASVYKGPRPGDSVSIRAQGASRVEFFKKHLFLSPEDDRGVVIAEAFRDEEEEPFFRWEW